MYTRSILMCLRAVMSVCVNPLGPLHRIGQRGSSAEPHSPPTVGSSDPTKYVMLQTHL